MKLQQGQIWKQQGVYYRIVVRERLSVRYKKITNLETGEGTVHETDKKAFCRLIKGATLLPTPTGRAPDAS